MKSLFVTGTDTEIGKTHSACALLHAFYARGVRAVPMKPIAAGTVCIDGVTLNEDVHALLAAARAGGLAPDAKAVNPYCFHEPIAPHIAAAHENVVVDFQVITQAFASLRASADIVVVEGAGGFLVPLDDTDTLAKLPTVLDLDVLLVVGMRLGCINHALLTAEAIAARGLRLAGWIANSPQPSMNAYAENLATLRARISAPLLGEIRFGASPQEAARGLDVTPLLGTVQHT